MVPVWSFLFERRDGYVVSLREQHDFFEDEFVVECRESVRGCGCVSICAWGVGGWGREDVFVLECSFGFVGIDGCGEVLRMRSLHSCAEGETCFVQGGWHGPLWMRW